MRRIYSEPHTADALKAGGLDSRGGIRHEIADDPPISVAAERVADNPDRGGAADQCLNGLVSVYRRR